jgi:hypothetical protein
LSGFRSDEDPVERFFARCRRREELRELERTRAMADEEDAVAYLAGIISKKTKKTIRSELERDGYVDFFARQHMWFGMNIRNELRKAGFVYDSLVMDGIWFSWLLKAIRLPENHVAVSSKIGRKIWNFRIKSYLRSLCHPVTGGSVLASAYVILIGMVFMKTLSEPIYIIPVLIMSLFPVYAAGYWIVKYL